MFLKLLEYSKLLRKFLDANYIFMPFSELPPDEGALLLRHDVDFDVVLADDLSRVEDEMGVKSTYFFMLRSKSYNIFEPEHAERLFSLMERGHSVSIHFDPTLYADFTEGLGKELDLFRNFFKVVPECISIHRPSEWFLNYDAPINNVRHTYQSVYCKRIGYFSDSQGAFSHGHPLESDDFLRRKSIHLLIHPVWWVTDNNSPEAILTNFLDARIKVFQQHMAKNCKPYRKFLEGQL